MNEELVKRLKALEDRVAALEALLNPKPQPFGAGGPGPDEPPPKP
jgi:hypothetical protein